MSDVLIRGYGVLTLSQAERKVSTYLSGAAEAIARGDWAEAHWIITGNGVLAATVDAVLEARTRTPEKNESNLVGQQ